MYGPGDEADLDTPEQAGLAWCRGPGELSRTLSKDAHDGLFAMVKRTLRPSFRLTARGWKR